MTGFEISIMHARAVVSYHGTELRLKLPILYDAC